MVNEVDEFGFNSFQGQAYTLAKLISIRLKELSIDLNEKHFDELVKRTYTAISEGQEFKIPKSIAKQAEAAGHLGNITIDVGNIPDDEFQKLYLDSTAELSERMQKTESLATYEFGKKNMCKILGGRRKNINRFNSRHRKMWSKTLDLLELYFLICFDLGAAFNEEIRPTMKATDYLLESLIRSHARGCQVAFEILTLLTYGYADGAHARWRTLHEISVVCQFLSEHGDDLAQRYLYYQRINSYFDAKSHRQNYKGIGEAPLSDEEFKALEEEKAELEKKFGSDFSEPNGWAKTILKDTRFANIEKQTRMEHLRPSYNLANINIHAGSKGLYFRLGQIPNELDVLLAGPSNSGIIDPADGAAISLGQITTFMLSSRINYRRLVNLQALQMLLNDLHKHFDVLIKRGQK